MDKELNYIKSNYFSGSRESDKFLKLLIEDKKDELFFALFNNMEDNVSYLHNYKNMVQFLTMAPEPKVKAFQFISDEFSYSFFSNPLKNDLSDEEKEKFKEFWGFSYTKEAPISSVILSLIPTKVAIDYLQFEYDNNNSNNYFLDTFYNSSLFFNESLNPLTYKDEENNIIEEPSTLNKFFILHLLKTKQYDFASAYMLLNDNFNNSFFSYSEHPVFKSIDLIPDNFHDNTKKSFLSSKEFLFLLTLENPIFFKNFSKLYYNPSDVLDSFISMFNQQIMDNNNESISFVSDKVNKFNKNKLVNFWEHIANIYQEQLITYVNNNTDNPVENNKLLLKNKEEALIKFLSLNNSKKNNNIFFNTLGIPFNSFFKNLSDNNEEIVAYLHNENLVMSLNQNPRLIFELSNNFDVKSQDYSLLSNLAEHHKVLYEKKLKQYNEDLANGEDPPYPYHTNITLKVLESDYSLKKEEVLKQFKEKPRLESFSSYENSEQLFLLSTQNHNLTYLNKELFEHYYPHFFAIDINYSINDLETFLPLFQKDFDNLLLRDNTVNEKNKISKFINNQKSNYDENKDISFFDTIENKMTTNISYLNTINYDYFYSYYKNSTSKPFFEYVNLLNKNLDHIDSFSNPEILLKHKDILKQFFKESLINTSVIIYNSYNQENIDYFHKINFSIFKFLSHPNVSTKDELYTMVKELEQSPLIDLFYTKEKSNFCKNSFKNNLSENLNKIEPLITSIEKIIIEQAVSFNNKKNKSLKF